jgi:cell division protein FtsI (penicillin-binding protein 3)
MPRSNPVPLRPRPVKARSKTAQRRTRSGSRRLASVQLPTFRLLMVWGMLFLGTIGLGWKLYQLQIVQGAELYKKARQQQTMTLSPYVPRRTITDVQGNILASDRLTYILYAHPKQFANDKENVAQRLALILSHYTAAQLQEKFNQQETGIRLASGLTEDVATAIRNLNIGGLDLEETYARYYPQQDMVADVIGYVDRDHQGQAGIERSQRKLLERDILNQPIRRTGNGTILPAFLPPKLLKSNDWKLQLTLDLRLQQAARSALRQQLKQFKAKRGVVIVMDVTDGSLVSLVCEPTYNPNEYYKANLELFKNWSVSDLYEPGSTFKPVNVAIALDDKKIQPSTIIHDSGSVVVDGWTINNASKSGNGAIDIARVLQTSSNVAMVHMMRRLDKNKFYDYLQALGLDEKTGIDLPGEATGHLKKRATFTERNIEVATTAFGQGFSLTPIKLAQLHSAIANGGNLVTPHVVKGLVDSDGNRHWTPDYPQRKVFSDATSRLVVDMMETVVSKGTGAAAKIAGYKIGGKTGTAQKAGARGGYLANAKITSFVAVLPTDRPRYVVLAVVDEPQGGNTFGSTVAAPVVKTVMEALISLKGIPPSSGSISTSP